MFRRYSLDIDVVVVVLFSLCICLVLSDTSKCSPEKCTVQQGASCKTERCGYGLACVNDVCMRNGTHLNCTDDAFCGKFDMVNLIRGDPVLVCHKGTCQPAGFVNDKCLGADNLCIGHAQCDKSGVCQGVSINGSCSSSHKPYGFDECAIGSYCSPSSGVCTAQSTNGKCSNTTECAPDHFCNGTQCVKRYAVPPGGHCTSTQACELGLYCDGGACKNSKNIGSPCEAIGTACNDTIPASTCMCVGEESTPKCYAPMETRGLPRPSSCNSGTFRGPLECATAHQCFTLDHGDSGVVLWVGGSCFQENCANTTKEYEECFCGYVDALEPKCNAVEECKAPSSCPSGPKCSTETGAACNATTHPTSADTVCGAGLACVDNKCQYNGTGYNCSIGHQSACEPFNSARIARGDSSLLQCINDTCQEVTFPGEDCSTIQCVGNAQCVKGTCQGVSIQDDARCHATPFDDCAPGTYCNGTGDESRCVEFTPLGGNCSIGKAQKSAQCTPNAFCDHKSHTCAALYANPAGSNCTFDQACQIGLLCINHTCSLPQGVGNNCTNVGQKCVDTVPETTCMCQDGQSAPKCLIATDPTFPPPSSCQGTVLAAALTCEVDRHCYMGASGWRGSCFEKNCKDAAKAADACQCDTIEADQASCEQLRICHKKKSSNKMPAWELAVIICASVIGGIILLAVILIVVVVFMFGGTIMNRDQHVGYTAVN